MTQINQNREFLAFAQYYDCTDYKEVVVPRMQSRPIYFDLMAYAFNEIPKFRRQIQADSNNKDVEKLAAKITLKSFLKWSNVDCRGQVLLQGQYTSFASWNGRASACKPPMMSVNSRMKPYLYAPEGYRLIEFDIANAEPRALASLTGDSQLLQDFEDYEDLYAQFSTILGPSKDSNRNQRTDAKATFISLTYGRLQSVQHAELVKQGYLPNNVKALLETFNKRYAGTWTCLETLDQCKDLLFNGEWVTPGVQIKPLTKRNVAPASVVAMLMKQWAAVVETELNIKVVNTVHDSLWVEVPNHVDLGTLRTQIIDAFELVKSKSVMKLFVKINMNVLGEGKGKYGING